MVFLKNIYANFFTVGALIPVIFYAFIAVFFFSIRDKSRTTLHLAIASVFIAIFNSGYFIAASWYNPNAAFHRWVTVGVIMLAETHVNMFVYYINRENKPTLFGRYFLIIQYAVAITLTLLFFSMTIHAEKVFKFAGHYWDFEADMISEVIGIAIVTYIIIFIILLIWKAATSQGKVRWLILGMGAAYLIESIVPSITNVLSRQGLLDRGTFQITWDMFNIVGFSLIVVLYLNYTKDRTTFLGKIIGVSLITMLLILQGFSYYSTQDQERSYDTIHQSNAHLSAVSPYRSADTEYITEITGAGVPVSTHFCRDAGITASEFNRYHNEMLNTLLYEKIRSLPDKNFLHSLKGLLSNNRPSFTSYRNLLLYFGEKITPKQTKKGAALLDSISSMQRKILTLELKIKALPVKGFKKELTHLLAGANPAIASFTAALSDHNKKTPQGNGLLKNGILRLFTHFHPSGKRIYRTINNTHYVSFILAQPARDIVSETGFSYIAYRRYLHPTVLKYIIMLGVVLFIIIIGFRVLFLGAFVRPLKKLVQGMRQVKNGNLEVDIPVKFSDEIGYISSNFNSMVETIKKAKVSLDDYAANLEKKVHDRTLKLKDTNEELEAAIHEMEAINETLVQTNNELEEAQRIAAMDMRMAINVQQTLFPAEAPRNDEWEISYIFKPKSGISGDMYDFYTEDKKITGLSLLDVSGHGIASGLITMIAKSAIYRRFSSMKRRKLSSIVEAVNDDIIEEIGSVDYYIAGIIIRFREKKQIEFVNAGYTDPLLHSKKKNEIIVLGPDRAEKRGTFLGIAMLKEAFSVMSFSMEKDDYLLLYSDCMIEAKNKNSEEYGIESLSRSMKNARIGNAAKRLEKIEHDLYAFTETEDLSDDLTAILIHRLK